MKLASKYEKRYSFKPKFSCLNSKKLFKDPLETIILSISPYKFESKENLIN